MFGREGQRERRFRTGTPPPVACEGPVWSLPRATGPSPRSGSVRAVAELRLDEQLVDDPEDDRDGQRARRKAMRWRGEDREGEHADPGGGRGAHAVEAL